MTAAHPEVYKPDEHFKIDVTLMHAQINSRANTILWILFAASGLLFVIASSNVANLVLARTVRRLAVDCPEVVAVDLTPVELRNRELRVVRVVAPALLPFLSHPGARYLGSRRLYAVPRRLGFPTLSEEEVNPWPSPLW